MRKLFSLQVMSLVVAVFSLVISARAQDAAGVLPPPPTLLLDFENGVAGVGRDGQTIAPRVEGKAEFQDGKFGKAFVSGPGAGYLHFPTAGVVSKQAGTVEMWVMPIDWSGDDEEFHMFFKVSGDGMIYLYKYYRSILGMLLLSNGGGDKRNRLTYKNVDDWKPGQWRHIAATWTPHRQALYIDGELARAGIPELPQSLDNEFLIGDHPFQANVPRTSRSLIDSVRIYDRALSPEVIAAHAAGDFSKTTPLSDTSAQLDFTVSDNRILPTITLIGADIDTRQSRVEFSVMQGGKEVKQQTGRTFDGVIAAADFADDLAPGEYVLRAVVRDAKGQSLGALNRPLTVPSREWMNNTLGEEKKVLPPWTPLVVQQNAAGFSVHCWGREYRFGDGLLPLQIIAKGEPLLQSPLRLGVLSGGKPLSWKAERAKVKDASDYEVNIIGSAVAQTPQGQVRVESNLHLEYDGLMVVTLKFQSSPNWKPGAVNLEIPVRADNALYRHGWQSDLKPFSGSLPPGTGVLQNGAFLPAAWLGDNERGLFWFCESAQFWPNWKSENAFQIARENSAVTMRLNLLNGQEPPTDWSFQFGLQATPVKPLPADWRKWRLSPAPRATAELIWPTTAPDSMQQYGYAQARDPQAFKKRVDALHAEGKAAIPYSVLNGLSGATPEWKWFGKDWDVQAGDYGSSDVVKVGSPLHYTSPTQESWRDFVVWKNRQFFKDNNLDGIYHDLTYPWAWAVPSANTGWFDGKEWHKTHPMLAYRELYRRHYASLKALKPDAFLMGHMSSRINIPVLAYEDAMLNGETLLTPLKGKNSYMDVISLDQWRAEYTGRQWGVMPFLLPEFDAVQREKVQPTRGLAALTMLHDVTPWPIWSNAKVWAGMFDALDAFGYVQSEFIPYWDAAPPATTDMKDVYVSVYKRADGRALAIVGNTSKEARTGTVTLNAKRIGLPTAGVLSWPDKKPLVQNGDKIELSVPGLDYQMLLIGKAP
jgi:hypothetical protein